MRGIPCEMADALGFASDKAAYYGRKVYVWSTVKATKVFSGAYKAGKAITSARRKSPVYYANALYANRLYRYITENGFDTVVMPHLFPAEAVTYMLRKYHLLVKTYFVATDYTCIPFTEETEIDYYFIPHEELLEEFSGKGIPREKLIPLGIPVSERFGELPDRDLMRDKLGIHGDGRGILVMTGSMGYGNVEKLLSRLACLSGAQDRIFVMGGTNEALKARLREQYAGDVRVRILDFTQSTQEYFAAADILFTKPGGLTSTEAVAAGILLAHTAPIPGCEERNAAYFRERGMAVSDIDEEKIAEKGMELLRDSAGAEKMRGQQRFYGKPDAARDICCFILRQADGQERTDEDVLA